MILKKYCDHHYDMIKEWQERRGNKLFSKDLIPSHGIVVEDIACGFLYSTDSAFGLIDGFITNPECSSIQRAKALDLILKNLIIWAKELGMRMVVARVGIRGTKKLALKNGFIDLGEYTSLMKEL